MHNSLKILYCEFDSDSICKCNYMFIYPTMNLKDDKPTVETIQEEYKLLLFNNRDLIKN